MQIYVVRAGDSLYALARRFGTTAEELRRLNQIADPSRLVIGQSLVVPGGGEDVREQIEVNAYVYPNVQEAVLTESMPYFTTLCPFSHQATMEGGCAPSRMNGSFRRPTRGRLPCSVCRARCD